MGHEVNFHFEKSDNKFKKKKTPIVKDGAESKIFN